MNRNYTIATTISIMQIEDNENYESNLQNLHKEQDAFIDFESIKYYVTKETEYDNNINYHLEWYTSLNEILQGLAIKEGIDVVKLENDTYGILAHYNNYKSMLEFREITKNEYEQLEELDNDNIAFENYFI